MKREFKPLLWIGVIFLALPAAAQLAAPPTLIRNVTLIDGTGKVQKNVDVHTLVGRIDEIGPNLKATDDDIVLDATGKYLIPGLIDLRVQLSASPANKIARSEYGNEQRTDWLHSLLRMGVTSVRLIQSELAEQMGFKLWRDRDLLNGPDVVVSGPTFTTENGMPAVEYGIKALQTRLREVYEVTNEDEAREKSRAVAHNGGTVFEISYTSGPDGKVARLSDVAFATIVKEAHGHDLKVMCWVGHNAEAAKAVAEGCDVLEGLTEEVFSDDVLKQMAAKKIAFLPAMVYQGYVINQLSAPDKLKAFLANPDFNAGLSPLMRKSLDADKGQLANLRAVLDLPVNASQDAMNAAVQNRPAPTPKPEADKPALLTFRSSYQQELQRTQENVKHARALGVPIVTGTVAGSVLNFPGISEHQELELLVQSGLTPAEALAAATRASAEAAGISKDYGTLEKGKWANMVLLDADPLEDIHNALKINGVMIHGRIIDRSAMYLY